MSTFSHDDSNVVFARENKEKKREWTQTGIMDASEHSSSTVGGDESANDDVNDNWVKQAKLTRKIDLHIVPPVAIIYMFCFLDRANVGNARLAGMERDLGMSGSDYNILLTAFYVAYIVFELPSNLLCKVVGPGKW